MRAAVALIAGRRRALAAPHGGQQRDAAGARSPAARRARAPLRAPRRRLPRPSARRGSAALRGRDLAVLGLSMKLSFSQAGEAGHAAPCGLCSSVWVSGGAVVQGCARRAECEERGVRVLRQSRGLPL